MQEVKREVQKKINLFLGQTELKGNSGFKEKWFERIMRKMGWKKYQSWCAYAAEAVWVGAYANLGAFSTVKELNKLFSASAVQTYKNFVNAGYPHGLVPQKGALAVWQVVNNGKYSWRGHMGVASKAYDNAFISAEGNTNVSGGREGIEFGENKHNIKEEMMVNNGLRFIGFVYLRDYIKKEGSRKRRAYEY